MIEHGVRVQSPRGDFTSHPAATADIDALAEADVIVIGLKAHSLPELAPAIGQRLRPGAVVGPAQNGLPWWYFRGRTAHSPGARSRPSSRWRDQPLESRPSASSAASFTARRRSWSRA